MLMFNPPSTFQEPQDLIVFQEFLSTGCIIISVNLGKINDKNKQTAENTHYIDNM